MQFSSPFLARSLVLRSVLFLAFDAAVSNRFTSGARLQYDVIHLCRATRSTTHHHDVGRLFL
eukprot:scaffold19629_cov67-Skeletonema_marinoi.AAC.1